CKMAGSKMSNFEGSYLCE
uniref:Uncharacterized protein n=1 Tax=Amphimedon queenslandica TaxID=400682 RepID=A0A1X7T4X4_AMPQE